MDRDTEIVDITADNVADHPRVICFINPAHEFYHQKIGWLKEQFKNGLKIKLLFVKGEKKPVGFIEYIPGKYCWRAVAAEEYMFIHCVWITGKTYQHRGLGKLLIEKVEEDSNELMGVAVATSDKSFMTRSDVFLKNGYKIVQESGEDQLMAKQFSDGPLPSINDWHEELGKYKKSGWTIIYSKQCPWVARFVEEVKPFMDQKKIEPVIIELKTPAQAQKAPSFYGVFSLIHDGRLLADRYISVTRFRNILRNEMNRCAAAGSVEDSGGDTGCSGGYTR